MQTRWNAPWRRIHLFCMTLHDKVSRARCAHTESSSRQGELEGVRRVLVVQPILWEHHTGAEKKSVTYRSPYSLAREACDLVEALGLQVAGTVYAPLHKIQPRTFLGKGKVEQVRNALHGWESLPFGVNDGTDSFSGTSGESCAEAVLINDMLSAAQQHDLETEFGGSIKVLDRFLLILSIFARRAVTKEAQVQVQLAAISRGLTRLRQSDKGEKLDQQRGSRGSVTGAGETKLELDRRELLARQKRLIRELEVVHRTRRLHAAGRQRAGMPLIGVVGYTNAGKTELVRRLAGLFSEAAPSLKSPHLTPKNQLFATLDPKSVQIELPQSTYRRAVITDTVGFVSQLPHALVHAFRSTLEHVLMSDVFLLVLDAAHPEVLAQRADALKTLQEIGMDTDDIKERCIEVWNKWDRLSPWPDRQNSVFEWAMSLSHNGVIVSARDGYGLDNLLRVVADRVARVRESKRQTNSMWDSFVQPPPPVTDVR